ncbi:MAG: hypothetical protein RL038_674 [Actinomycetota bacterium]|jgi:putative Holliday junction resolvase
MRNGIRFALDLGAVRIGVAKSDPSGILASPFTVWPADSLMVELKKLLDEYTPLEIYIGLPKDLRGQDAIAATAVRSQATLLKQHFSDVNFLLVDERMTTAEARKQLQQAGYNTKTDRQLIDAAAATVLLQAALEAERIQGEPRGEVL